MTKRITILIHHWKTVPRAGECTHHYKITKLTNVVRVFAGQAQCELGDFLDVNQVEKLAQNEDYEVTIVERES